MQSAGKQCGGMLAMSCCKLYILLHMHDMLRRQAVWMIARLFSAVLCAEWERVLNGAGEWQRHAAAQNSSVAAASARLAA